MGQDALNASPEEEVLQEDAGWCYVDRFVEEVIERSLKPCSIVLV